MRLSYHPLANIDVIDAAAWYDSRRLGLGAEFLDAIDSAVATIAEFPERWPIVRGDVRSRAVGRFPYSVEYQIINDEIWILVVKHHSRNPNYGSDRG